MTITDQQIAAIICDAQCPDCDTARIYANVRKQVEALIREAEAVAVERCEQKLRSLADSNTSSVQMDRLAKILRSLRPDPNFLERERAEAILKLMGDKKMLATVWIIDHELEIAQVVADRVSLQQQVNALKGGR